MGCLITTVAAAETFSLGQAGKGTLVSVKNPPIQSAATAERPPLEGPLTYLAFTATDQRSLDELDTAVTAHLGLDGNVLPEATSNFSLGILDSGAATHLLNFTARVERGIEGEYQSGQKFPVGGVGGSTVEVDVSMPIGIFTHGLQDLSGGMLQTGRLVGQGNFPMGVNTEENDASGFSLPTAIGAPLLAQFVASVRNSQPVVINHNGERISSPAVELFADPFDFAIPEYNRKVFLEYTPGGDIAVAFFALPDFANEGYLALLPALVGQLSGNLYRTASANLRVSEGDRSRTVKLMFDTGAQACILSESVAADLSLNTSNPDFEVDVEGIGGTETAPGFYIDGMSIPSSGGDLEYIQIPAVIVNVTGPDGGTLDGILGSNLLANRDFVFYGASAQPYVDISEPVVEPEIRITATRLNDSGDLEIDWRSEPAAPVLVLDEVERLPATEGDWSGILTGELPTVAGTMTVTNPTEKATFRLRAP